jgi:L-lactate dehydrogenase complex protein LldG
MSARERILDRIRANSGKTGATTDAERSAVRAHIAQHARGPVPESGQQATLTARVAQFKKECERLKTSVDEILTENDVPQALAGYLEQNGLKKRVVAWVSFSNLPWSSAGIQCEKRMANGDDLVGVTDCFCAISETGTLVLLSSPATPKLTALLPETHVCIVRASRLVNTMEEAVALQRQEQAMLPRATFLVSGPSRTADIEQTIVIGAHGPYRVHVILIHDAVQ